MLLSTVFVVVVVVTGLSTLTLGIPLPGRRGYGHRHRQRPQNHNQRLGFRPHHPHLWNKFGGSGILRRPPPFTNIYDQKPFENTGIRQYPSSQLIILPYQTQNGQGLHRPWGQVQEPQEPKSTSPPSVINPGRPLPSGESTGGRLTDVTQGVDPNNPTEGVPDKVIVDEAGPVLPGPSKWVQEDLNSRQVNGGGGQGANEGHGSQPNSQQGDPSEGEGSQDGGGAIAEDAGQVLPGPSEWIQEGLTTDEVSPPISIENDGDDKKDSIQATPNSDYGNEEVKDGNSSTNEGSSVDENIGETSPEEGKSSTEGAAISNVDEYLDISELIDVRGNFG